MVRGNFSHLNVQAFKQSADLLDFPREGRNVKGTTQTILSLTCIPPFTLKYFNSSRTSIGMIEFPIALIRQLSGHGFDERR